MRQPTEPSEGAQSQSVRQIQEALRLLEAAGISPLSRPRVLAAARALGVTLTLTDWYQAAWQLESGGMYRRGGNGESEWLELVPPTIVELGEPPLAVPVRRDRLAEAQAFLQGESSWTLSAFRSELERIHDADALFALADAI